ncbi:hypothetical protein DM01DRAFT_297490 [Hesseltinella vesiculosa]|uniref:Uncharacterized protein n=1 Tax=Hesseltinella vesiculosa TaxID=101127 RepID=A0A1X2GHH3_9FUNG|nr:hypothetical protein DM01DRAFT_297490 [Hesseltinella vesiculosa]
MPFRCKCGRTFEKPDSFSSHTSSCAPFHQRRTSSSTGGSVPSSPILDQASSPTMDYYPSFMPTALSLQNAFEGVRRRSMSYSSSFK